MNQHAVEIECLPTHPAPALSWRGVAMLQGGKGYAATPLGQVHYRDVGPRDADAVMLLIHQSPMSMVEFGAVQNSLATLGIRSIATDTPGYGMSDQPGMLPTIGGFADNLVHVLDHLGVEKVVASGHHTGACISTALGARHPDRVAGVVLHGCPLYNDDERAQFLAHAEWDRSSRSDGSHLSQLFGRPGAVEPSEEEMFVRSWMSVTMFLQGADIGHWAVNRYVMATDLMALTMPGMILTEYDDVIHHMDLRGRVMRPDFAYGVLGEKGSAGLMCDPGGWAKLAADFIATIN